MNLEIVRETGVRYGVLHYFTKLCSSLGRPPKFITGKQRTNGQSCPETADTDLCLNYDDGKGVSIASHEKLRMTATQEIVLFSENKIKLKAPSQILIKTPDSGISMETEVHYSADNVIIDGSDTTEFPPVDQPVAEENPGYVLRQPKKFDIDWAPIWKSMKNAVTAVAEFTAGGIDSVATNVLFMPIDENTRPHSRAYNWGRLTGDVLSVVAGGAEWLGGGILAAGSATAGLVTAPETGGGSLVVAAGGVSAGRLIQGLGIVTGTKSLLSLQDDLKNRNFFSKEPESKPNTSQGQSNDKATTGANKQGKGNPQGQMDDLYKGQDKAVKPTKVIGAEDHARIPKNAEPNSVVDYVGKDGKVNNRCIYNEESQLTKQINPNDHGMPKAHPYGKQGEHAHDFTWENGKIKERTTRELTDSEKLEHQEILK